jgi:hypothetical protein
VYEPAGSGPGFEKPVAHSGEHPRMPLGVVVGVGAGGEAVIAALAVGRALVEGPLHAAARKRPKAESAASAFIVRITSAITPSLWMRCSRPQAYRAALESGVPGAPGRTC